MTGLPVIIQTIEAPPIRRGDTTITPLVRIFLFRIRLPIFRNWASYSQWWGWKRPAGLIVQTGDNPPQRIPIIDRTRILQFALFGFGMLIASLIRRRINR